MSNNHISSKTFSVEEFVSDPNEALEKGEGAPVAITAKGDVQFYAVPAKLFEDIINYVEYMQRGNTELKTAPGKFNLTADMVDDMTERLKNLSDDDLGEFIECEKNT
ncbi:conserved hypothetical protein [Hahella chejuensis KCTC 2396]|uniref:Antitoxin of toxin-antitoxin stability system n=1 Tax=Hahella chejuensis (strain KCTC 2396) TaxID=349521 RepID=Q2SFM5_HAHCH|nr:hypothetical protein [Hahella chejuensis]ABC30549.1 conserved hypothetical protein [Hahella chejuensis KCTC 2396]